MRPTSVTRRGCARSSRPPARSPDPSRRRAAGERRGRPGRRDRAERPRDRGAVRARRGCRRRALRLRELEVRLRPAAPGGGRRRALPRTPDVLLRRDKARGGDRGRRPGPARGPEASALRFATIYAPGKADRHAGASVLSRLLDDAVAGRPVRIAGGGDQLDDMIWIGDATAGVLAAATPRRRCRRSTTSQPASG